MERNHLLTLTVLCLTCGTASAATGIEGLAIKVGYNSTSGDLGDGKTSGGVTVGADYTFANGFIIGVNYKPEFVGDEYHEYGSDYSEHEEITADMITPYIGFQVDTMYFHAGVGIINIDYNYRYNSAYGDYNDENLSLSDDDTGAMLGFGAQLPNNMMIDASATFLDWEGLDGTNWNISLGYKF